MMTPKERLLLLADKLDEDAGNPTGLKFDLFDWFGNKNELRLLDEEPHINCGTIGCAIGLAMLTPEFNEEGFTKSSFLTPKFDGKHQWDAVQAYFGIERKTALNLFGYFSYSKDLKKGADTERAVAKRIREHASTM